MRLFIGLPLSDSARADTARLAAHAAGRIPGRYSLAENYHITLAFLGEAPQARLEEAAQVLRRFAARFPAPCVVLGDLSYFRQRSNAILIRRADSPDDLAAMREFLAAQLDRHALPHADGPFSPHVTLARHADLSGAADDELSAPSVSYTAPQAVLYLSARDEKDVLRYTPLFAAAFGK